MLLKVQFLHFDIQYSFSDIYLIQCYSYYVQSYKEVIIIGPFSIFI
jgi:hypothetical protein